MDLTGVPTPRVDWDSANLLEAFRRFRQHVSLMFDGPYKDKSDEAKVAYLLLFVGERVRKYTIR